MNQTLTIVDVCPVCGGERWLTQYTSVYHPWSRVYVNCEGCPRPTTIEIRLIPPCRICKVEPETRLDGLCDGCREAKTNGGNDG